MQMRYVIGFQLVTKEYGIEDGILVFDRNTCARRMCLTRRNEESRVYQTFVFESALDAQKYAKRLSKDHAKDFQQMAQNVGADINLFRFYPLKADSIKFATNFKLSNPRKKSAGFIENDDSVQGQMYDITRHKVQEQMYDIVRYKFA